MLANSLARRSSSVASRPSRSAAPHRLPCVVRAAAVEVAEKKGAAPKAGG
jgi:hypothetical protein